MNDNRIITRSRSSSVTTNFVGRQPRPSTVDTTNSQLGNSNSLLARQSGSNTTRLRLPPVENLRVGYFAWLPNDVLFQLFSICPVELLGKIAMISREMSSRVSQYIVSVGGKQKIGRFLNVRHDKHGRFSKLGVLCKRLTFLYPTQRRLTVLQNVLQQFGLHPQSLLKKTTAADLCGAAGHSFIAGWERPECTKYYVFLCNATGLSQLLEASFLHDAGCCCALENQLCTFYRTLFLEQKLVKMTGLKTGSVLFWTKSFFSDVDNLSRQSRMLFLFYGPRKISGALMWSEMIDSYPSAYITANEWFGKLSSVLVAMSKSSLFGLNITVNLFFLMVAQDEDQVNCEFEWMMDNVACVLILSLDNKFVLKFLLLLCEKEMFKTCGDLLRQLLVTVYRFRPALPSNLKLIGLNSACKIIELIKSLMNLLSPGQSVMIINEIITAHNDTLADLKDETDPESFF